MRSNPRRNVTTVRSFDRPQDVGYDKVCLGFAGLVFLRICSLEFVALDRLDIGQRPEPTGPPPPQPEVIPKMAPRASTLSGESMEERFSILPTGVTSLKAISLP
jgi:hypothetical protein